MVAPSWDSCVEQKTNAVSWSHANIWCRSRPIQSTRNKRPQLWITSPTQRVPSAQALLIESNCSKAMLSAHTPTFTHNHTHTGTHKYRREDSTSSSNEQMKKRKDTAPLPLWAQQDSPLCRMLARHLLRWQRPAKKLSKTDTHVCAHI